MPFGIIGRTGAGMRQVVAFVDRSTRRGTFGGGFGAPLCNRWGLYGVPVDFRSDAALSPNYFGHTCYIRKRWFTSDSFPASITVCSCREVREQR